MLTATNEPAEQSPPAKPTTAKAPTIASVPVPGRNGARDSAQLLEKARADADTVLKELGSQLGGLSEVEAGSRLKQVGTNEIAREKRQSVLMRLLSNVKNPLVLLLMALGVLSYLTGDLRATAVIFVMVVLGVVLRFFQELRADNAAEKLQAMVSNTATLVRDGKEAEVSLKLLVPGDIIRLAAGDMVPADVRVLLAKDLFLNQAALTGEALPVEKKAAPAPADVQNPLDLPNLCFLGSNVESGSATAVVIHTGGRTCFGSLAASIVGQRQLTSFDLGINKFTWLMTSLQNSASDNFRKALLLAAASHFEHKICNLLVDFVKDRSSGSPLIEAFVRNKAISRQYHTLFSWDENNANKFFGLFGKEFREAMTLKTKESDNLAESIKAFLQLGNERNRMVHQDYASFALDKTLDEIYQLYQKGLFFVENLPKDLRDCDTACRSLAGAAG